MSEQTDFKTVSWAVGDVVRLKKPHPCGGYEWEVLRIGMDFRLKCLNCGRYLMLTRQDFIKRVKTIITKA